ncbi:MAG: toprim domain-containing protein [Planctomycetaceae bacterium]
MTRHGGQYAGGAATLEPCRAAGPGSGAELFVVEGESASAAVARLRDLEHQAVLPMRGKPLNAVRASEKRVAAHAHYRALADAIGTDLGGRFDAAGLRFDRILLLMDPDADGIHCGVLVLMFLHRWMRPLVDAGRVEIVRPPWGEVTLAGDAGLHLAFSPEELVTQADRLRDLGAVTSRRYRGLAAIDGRVLHATCVAPATRRTERVTAAQIEAMIALLDGVEDPGG